MNIYLVERAAPGDYKSDAIVVVANDEEEAKLLNLPPPLTLIESLSAAYLADLKSWYPSTKQKDSLRVTKIGIADPPYTTPTLVLASFNAG